MILGDVSLDMATAGQEFIEVVRRSAALDRADRKAAARSGGARTYPTWMEEVAGQSRWHITDYALYANQAKAYAQSSWVYVCVSRISETMAGVPYHVSRLEGEERVSIENHPLELLLRRPNHKWSGFELMEATNAYLGLCGNCYWYLNPESGAPLEMWLLRPDRMQVVPDRREWIKGYIYTVNGVPCPLTASEVIHFKRFHPLKDYEGLSAIEAAALPIELDNKAMVWDLSFFKESAMPSAIVDVGNISDGDYEDVKHQWEGKYKGASKAHKTAFVRGGDTKVTTISIPHKDMQFLEMRQFTREEIFNIFGVPLGMFSENATEANALVAERTFYNQTLHPKLQRLGAKIDSELLTRFGEGLLGEFEDIRIGEGKDFWLEELSIVCTGAVGASGMPAPVMSIDEIREKYFDMDAYPSEAPTSLGETEGESEEAGEAAGEIKRDLRRWRDVSLRLVNSNRNPGAREFKSEIIPDDVRTLITERLWLAPGPEEVKAIFADPFAVSAPPEPFRDIKQDFEQQIQRALLALWAEQSREAVAWLEAETKGLPEDFLKAAMWKEASERLIKALLPLIEVVAFEGVKVGTEAIPFQIGVDWTLVNTDAAKWARKYCGELVKGIDKTTKARLRQAIANWVEAGEPLPDLVRRVDEIFNNLLRAELIASTEVTNGFAEGNVLGWEASGVVEGYNVETSADHLVCPLCDEVAGDGPYPLNDREHLPSLHPRCRCWPVPVVMKA